MVAVGTAMVRGGEGGKKQRWGKKVQRERRNGELVELHRVVKSGSCNGQGPGKCSGRGKEGGDTEMAGKYCSRQEGDTAKYQ